MTDTPDTSRERVERFAAWLESLQTATWGFRVRAQQRRLQEAAALLRALLTRAEAAERTIHHGSLANHDLREELTTLRAQLAALVEHKNELVLAVHDRHHHTKPQNRKDVVALAVEMVLSELRAILKGDDDA